MDGSKFELSINFLSGNVSLSRRYANGEVKPLDPQPSALEIQILHAAGVIMTNRAKEGLLQQEFRDGSRLVYYPSTTSKERMQNEI